MLTQVRGGAEGARGGGDALEDPKGTHAQGEGSFQGFRRGTLLHTQPAPSRCAATLLVHVPLFNHPTAA
jgi:hypothetical protein